jgi:hypothetical protein
MTELTHAEIQELLGVYALDAVEGEEREAVELHLRECPRCRAEVAEHREVAALIAHGGTPAPAGVWDRIVTALDETPPRMRIEVDGPGGTVVPFERPGPTPAPARVPASSRFGRARVALLGAAAVLIVLLGALVVRLDDRVDDLEGGRSAMQLAASALEDPSSRRGTLELHDGRVRVPAAITADGTGYLLAEDTPRLTNDVVYQLWGVHDSTLISLGTFDGRSEVVTFHVDPAISGLAVTEEDAPGSPTPTKDPIGIIDI